MDAIATAKLALDSSSFDAGLQTAKGSVSKFSKTIGTMTAGAASFDVLSISSQKAGNTVKQLANIFSESKNPVVALAGSVDGLAKAFGFGLGATIAVVGITEAIKVFVSNSEKMNAITEALNSSIKDFQSSVGLLNFEEATSQVTKLSNALQKAKDQMPASEAGGFFDEILTRTGKGVADVSLASARANLAIGEAQTAQQQAKYAAETALNKENELSALRLINAEEAKRVEIQMKYEKEINSARRQGLLTPGVEAGLTQRRDLAMAALEAPAQQKAKEEQIKNYQSILSGLGLPTGATSELAKKQGTQNYQSALSGVAVPSASALQSPSAGLFSGIVDEVRVIKQYVVTISDLMDKRLGVPILRSAS